MKRKAVIALIGAMSMSFSMMPAVQSMTAFAAEAETETAVVETVVEDSQADEEVSVQDQAAGEEAAQEAQDVQAQEAQPETEEAAQDRRKITLKDIDYKEGKIDKKGWRNDFFMIGYRPEKGVAMDPETDDILEGYYEREGKDDKVATSEMVAFAGDDSYIQIMAEINPIGEKKADILEDFMKTENFKADTVTGASKVGDIEFATVDGKTDDGSCLLAVSDSKDGVVLAIKVKYTDDKAKGLLLAGFVSIEENREEAAETEIAAEEPAETEAVSEAADGAEEATDAVAEQAEEVPADAETEADAEQAGQAE